MSKHTRFNEETKEGPGSGNPAPHQRQRMEGNEEWASQAAAMMAEMQSMRRQLEELQASRPNTNYEKMKRPNPPTFFGKETEDVLQYLFDLEEYYHDQHDQMEEDSSRFVRNISGTLKGSAATWYRNYAEQCNADGVERTYTDFKEKIKRFYITEDYAQKLLEKMSKLRQKESVATYNQDMMKLFIAYQGALPEEVRQYFYAAGLHPRLKTEVRKANAATVEESMRQAQLIEKALFPNGYNKDGPKKPEKQEKKDDKSLPRFTCYSCGRKGHKSPECKATNEEKQAYKAKRDSERST